MSNEQIQSPDPDMRDHYDFSRGIQGKYAQRYAQRTHVIELAPDVAAVFPTAQAVNDALRSLIQIARRTVPQSQEA